MDKELDNYCQVSHERVCRAIENKLQLHIEVVNQKLTAIREATKIQTVELDRRLEILNGHQTELKADRDQFVRHERYDDRMDTLDKWIDEAKKSLNMLTGDYERRINKAQLISIIAVGVSIVSTFLHLIIK